MSGSGVIDELVEALRCLPGVGPKSAQRMVMHLLERDREGGRKLAERMRVAMEQVGHCSLCRNLTELTTCELCSNPARDASQLCIVETPADVVAIEQSAAFRGRYFVLLGHLSPIDGLGPNEIGMPELAERARDPDLREVIVATNPTVEGEATAHYISELLADRPLTLSRIAHGIPVGGELEYVDGGTLAHALGGRTRLNNG
ncbi:MAG: recombination protein RecR [Gammaproteobacteria bacterium]|nr:recombination protein RecR [Gammaproteobacteria bacterium]MBS05235.1 recombination protein RecR [Gammaproteobacteria bacterium]